MRSPSPTEAQIYVADGRGCSRANGLRSYHTFNFGAYVAEGREPFGPLYLLNDDSLRAGASLTMRVETPTDVLLLPVTGGLEYRIGQTDAPNFLEPGQAGWLSLTAGVRYTVTNPYETETIQFLQLWLKRPPGNDLPAIRHVLFNLGQENALLPLLEMRAVSTAPANVSACRIVIGRFGGRQDGTYPVAAAAGAKRGLFVFVLRGAFEVVNRLLHENDGLALTYAQPVVVAFEALSNDAILLLLELPVGPV